MSEPDSPVKQLAIELFKESLAHLHNEQDIQEYLHMTIYLSTCTLRGLVGDAHTKDYLQQAIDDPKPDTIVLMPVANTMQ